MLAFVIFAITFVVVLLLAVFYLYPGSSRVTTIPGLDPSDPKEGNIPDIIQAGGLHPFLVSLHEANGTIAGFWYGGHYVVSISSPDLFKEHIKVFDRPPLLFQTFEPLIGNHSIQYKNGADGRLRRKIYDRHFNHEACKIHLEVFKKVGQDLAKKWESLPASQHVPLHQYMMALALKAILGTAFGTFFCDEKKIVEFNRYYDIVWAEFTARMSGPLPDKDDPRELKFQEALNSIHTMVREIIEARKEKRKTENNYLFLDTLMDSDLSNEEQLSDAITYIVGGFHTTGNLMTWLFYFLATHKDVQEKIHQEIKSNLEKEPLTINSIDRYQYTKQVINETLRLSALAPYAARYQNVDVKIGGHIIPKDTPVIHALGVSLQDGKYWPLPDKFDPDRFSPGNVKSRPPLSFSPFGFAGQRICPGQKFAYIETTIYISIICSMFTIDMVEGQVVTPSYSLVSRPEDEIWVTISKRP